MGAHLYVPQRTSRSSPLIKIGCLFMRDPVSEWSPAFTAQEQQYQASSMLQTASYFALPVNLSFTYLISPGCRQHQSISWAKMLPGNHGLETTAFVQPEDMS